MPKIFENPKWGNAITTNIHTKVTMKQASSSPFSLFMTLTSWPLPFISPEHTLAHSHCST